MLDMILFFLQNDLNDIDKDEIAHEETYSQRQSVIADSFFIRS